MEHMVHRILKGSHPPPPPSDDREGSGNYSQQLTTQGAITTILVSVVIFVMIQVVFEVNRFYKQIFLKRLQKRFQEIGRVPPIPPNFVFGWLVAIMQLTENDVLRMVGLDAYMLLRYMTVCFKLSVFMSFWGLLILVPLYSTASTKLEWDKYTLSNVISANDESRFRLWAAAVFGYVFSAYFCQLLYAEYHNFSVNRLKYLVQADPDSPQGDPDTPPQKYFTVMVERIPAHLRSAVALHKFFDNLFPGEVYDVEIALDLAELHNINQERKAVRDRLEQSIAFYEATNTRPLVYIQTGKPTEFPDSTSGMAGDTESWVAFFQKLIAPEMYGFENLDALNYYTERLIELNNKMVELQKQNYEFARKSDKELERKIRNRHDTRAAAVMQSVAQSSAIGMKMLKMQGGLEALLFGPEVEDYKKVAETEMIKVELDATDMLHHSQDMSQSLHNSSHDDLPKNHRQSIYSSPDVASVAEYDRSQFSQSPPTSSSSSQKLFAPMEDHHPHHGVSVHNTPDSVSRSAVQDHHSDERRDSFGSNTRSNSIKPFRNSSIRASQDDDDETPRLQAKVQPTADNHSPAAQPMATQSAATRKPRSFIDIEGGALVRKVEQIDESSSSQSSASSSSAPSRTSTTTTTQSAVTRKPRSFLDIEGGSLVRKVEQPVEFEAPPGSPEPTSTLIANAPATSSPNPTSTFIGRGFSLDYLVDAIVGDPRGDTTMNPLLAQTATDNFATLKKSSPSPTQPLSLGPEDVGQVGASGGGGGGADAAAGGGGGGGGGGMYGGGNPRTEFSRQSSFMSPEQLEQANFIAMVGAEKAKQVTKEGWEQTKLATSATWRGVVEMERTFEMLTFGAYYKYSSTAFVTFNSRVTESIAHQMLLSHDAMEISHAPNPHDIIWENVAIPKSQIMMRNFIVNIGLSVGSLFWSSLVNCVNQFSIYLRLSPFQQQYMSVVIMLAFLFSLPVVFDALARYYEGMKLESEIQNSIMARYFYYQLVNIYVTVGLGTQDIFTQIYNILRDPQVLVDVLAKTVPSVSLYFLSLVVVKIFAAVPMEMVRPWQLSTILGMSTFMDRRLCTRRDLRTGAFYAWPMLYGWVYPQLMLVLIIQVTYSCIAPLLMPLCAVFFVFAYLMYKYQLLYVYINDYQSGGYMWYAVFTRSLIALLFSALTLLGYLSLELQNTYFAGPFYFMLPLPICIIYFWHYTEAKFKKQSMNLSLQFAKELDIRNRERKASGKPVPHDVFSTQCYRQPALTEKPLYPEPYRVDGSYEYLRESAENGNVRFNNSRERRGSLSINVHELVDEGEDSEAILQAYFQQVVLPLSKIPEDMDDEEEERQRESMHRTRSR